MSDFTLGVVNVWGGECLGGERLTIRKNSLLASSKMVKGSQRRILQVLIFSTSLPRCPCRPQCRRPSNYMYIMLSDMLKAQTLSCPPPSPQHITSWLKTLQTEVILSNVSDCPGLLLPVVHVVHSAVDHQTA